MIIFYFYSFQIHLVLTVISYVRKYSDIIISSLIYGCQWPPIICPSGMGRNGNLFLINIRNDTYDSFFLFLTDTSCADSDFVCPEEFGYYQHPGDCSKYYVCVFGGPLLESCTGGLMYR